MGKIGYISIFLFLLAYTNLAAQDIKVEGYFMQDSAKLGERVGYVLKATYPSTMDILFPDSLYNYGSMEFLGKTSFTSYTQDTVTLDSAIYYLSNFSLEPVKTYSLPVFEVLRYDSITHRAPDAFLSLKLTIDQLPDVLTFEETNAYQRIRQGFNYPLLSMILAAVLVGILILFYLFGKRIRNTWIVYLEKKKRKKFLSQWKKAKEQLFSKKDHAAADELLGLWKSYMESLTGKPFREWTSTEIALHLNLPELVKDFREIEVIIYANRVTEDLTQSCKKLTELSENAFNEKIKKFHGHE